MKRAALVLLLVAAAGVAYYLLRPRPAYLVLTGIVTTHDVVVSPQIAGQVDRLLVNEGDAVTRNQLLGVIAPAELEADRAYYAHTAAGASALVRQAEASLRYQEQQTAEQIRQAESALAAAEAQQAEAEADLENARLAFERNRGLAREDVVTSQQFDEARTGYDAARAHLDALKKQVEGQRAALALARSNAEQVAVRESQLQSNRQQRAAADAERTKATVRLGYAELRSPIDAVVDVRPVQPGEVVTAGQPVLTLIDPDDLWVRVDVEETYIDSIRLGEHLTVRLPSGVEREGTVFYRGVDAGFATARDVSRTKRDIKTFEVRLRVDNRDRRLAAGLTAYVLLPVPR